ncbi:MAG: TM2 domain-containing protein [Defluviicoccus sp.]|nr:TM2 domain-containing protein [Defluviicoccus sp.]MDG4592568.1 TM2 domain-containing protein [Defluviicoccus sp.]
MEETTTSDTNTLQVQPSQTLNQLPSSISSDAKKMMQYDANKKSSTTAYLLWFFLGWSGAHRFYIGNTGTGAAILILSVVGFALSVVGVGFIILLVPLIWLIVDLFLIPGMVRDKNNSLIQTLS